jgi:hypothetical protein
VDESIGVGYWEMGIEFPSLFYLSLGEHPKGAWQSRFTGTVTGFYAYFMLAMRNIFPLKSLSDVQWVNKREPLHKYSIPLHKIQCLPHLLARFLNVEWVVLLYNSYDEERR